MTPLYDYMGFVNHQMGSCYYWSVLSFGDHLSALDWTFQQDKAVIHVSNQIVWC